MLVTSSQSSTQRPLGLSVEELYALDRQYRRIEQQQQHLAQLQAQTRLTSSNLNRIASRSLDLVAAPLSNPSTVLPSLEIHGHAYGTRPHPSPSSALNYPRSHSIDHFRYTAPPPPPPIIKHIYPQRSTINDTPHQHYQSKYKTYLQQPIPSTGNASSLGTSFMYDSSTSSMDYSDNRASCKLRRQQPLRRESSRRIVVRPIIHRRREPSISSSCESLDESRSPSYHSRMESNNLNRSNSTVEYFTDDLSKQTNKLVRNSITHDSSSEDGEINLYEMRVPIGKAYDTSDISVQLEGPKILIHCHTIEPTDKRGNYRKHELKTELYVPDVVNDETIVSYLTEEGDLIVEGKYHLWAWKEMKNKRQTEHKDVKTSSSLVDPKITSTKNDTSSLEQERTLTSNNRSLNNPLHHIEKLENNRTVIHVGDLPSTQQTQHVDARSVSDMVSRFNTLNDNLLPNIWDGQYSFTDDSPPVLIYHLRLSLETLMDEIRVQSDPKSNILKIFIEQQEKNVFDEQQVQSQNKLIIRSTSRICRLPRDRTYDYTRLRVNFLKDNFIRIEIPTLT